MTQIPTHNVTPQQLVEYLGRTFFQRDVLRANLETFARSVPRNSLVVVAAMQKSGSTFMHYALSRVLGRPMNMACWSGDEGSKRAMFFPFTVRDSLFRRTVSRAHMPASEGNVELLRAFNVTPLVLVRNLFDVVVSARDDIVHKLGETAWGPRFQGRRRPFFPSDDPAEQYDKIIDMAVPEYVQFYVSWYEAMLDEAVSFRWISYEELIRDKPATLAAALEFLGLPQPEEKVRRVIDELEREPQRTQRNRAVAGRGEALLSAAQKARIEAMTRHYPWVDFERIGIRALERAES